ncbi:cytochrome P450 82A3-like [Senna tora]|uniref:Cytochrome P450 82A3-like n=1 Tax=Senna tora TaxID=362788 RepID=A0A834WPD5_9FABA|nr:cytochrome P450 82A3-like [Senna tora]
MGFDVMSFLNCTIVGFVSVVVVCFFVSGKLKEGKKKRWAPVAGGGWPIIGHLPLLSGSNIPHYTLGALADKYGHIFTISLGSKPALVISNWEMAKECYTTNDLAVSTRPRVVAVQRLTYNQAMFLFSPYGSYWRQIRKLATLHLLSTRRVELLTHVRLSQVQSCVQELFQLCTAQNQKKQVQVQVLVDLSQRFGELTINTVLTSMCGKRYFGSRADVKEQDAQLFLKTLREFVRLLGVFVVGDALPYLRWLDLGGHEKHMNKTAKQLDSLLNEWLVEHRRKRASADHHTGDRDFIDAMLSALGTSEMGGYDADTINKATTLILIAGGVDTSTVTLIWAMCRLLNNPDVLKEAQKELDREVGRERRVEERDISKLVYVQAIVKETLRLHPPASLSGLRMFSEDCTIGGYHIAKGTRLITNLWKIQTDPRVWSEPLEFKPERFLTTHKDVDVRGHHFELIPFGCGRRICPGISFGLQTIHLTLATFLHSFEFSRPSHEPIDMTEVFGLTTMKATPLQALIKPRLSSHLYHAL